MSATLEQLAQAFEAWENGFRAEPSKYLTAEGCAAANVSSLSADRAAVATLIHYYEGRLSSQNTQHADAVLARVRDFQRFMNEHPERMNYPDTAVSPD